MKLTHVTSLVAPLFLISLAGAQSTAVYPGAAAPQISVKKWVKGEPVNNLSGDGVYVVEFWATWCGPCIQSIPHLTELAKKNPDVTFVGVSIWEDDKSQGVEKFVANMGEKMDYHVAYGGNHDGMASSWMAAASQNGIPTAFIVKNQKVQWVGHPMALETPLAKVIAGTNDLSQAKSEFDASVARTLQAEKAQAELRIIKQKFDKGDRPGAHADMDRFTAAHPEIASSTNQTKLLWLAEENPRAFGEKVDAQLASDDKRAVYSIGSVCIRLAQNQPGKALAVSTIEKCLGSTKENDLIILYYATAVYKSTKEQEKMKRVATHALKFMDANTSMGNEEMRKVFTDSLK